MKLFSTTLQLLSYLPMFIFFLMLLVPETVHSFKCGLKNSAHRGQNRIINGQQADKNEWPWMASLRKYYGEGYSSPHVCGASVISSRWVITAAHCLAKDDGSVKYEDKDIKIYLGAHKKYPTQTDNYDAYSVEKFIVHEGWNGTDNDIAVIKVSKKIDISKHTPVCLPGQNEDFTGSQAIATGWGKKSYVWNSPWLVEPQDPDVLQEVSLTIREPSICRVPSGQGYLCAKKSAGHAGLCNGDSGGPLTVEDRKGRHTLVGISNFVLTWTPFNGIELCDERKPTYFADVSFYRDWIREKTGI